jgi:hypothetical protein
MSEQQQPARRGPRPKSEREPHDGISLQPRPNGRVFVEVRMELSMQTGIELLAAAAKAHAEDGKGGRAPATHWQPPGASQE